MLKNKKSVFYYFFRSYMWICLFIIVVFAIIFFIIFRNSMTKEVINTNIDKLNQTEIAIELYLSNIENEVSKLLMDDIILDVDTINNDNFTEMDNVLLVQEFIDVLKKLERTSPVIKSIYYVNFNQDFIITSNGYAMERAKFWDIQWLDYYNTDNKQLSRLGKRKVVYDGYGTSEPITYEMFSMVSPISNYIFPVNGAIFVNINVSDFAQYLNNYLIKDNEAISIYEKKGYLVSSTNANRRNMKEPLSSDLVWKITNENTLGGYSLDKDKGIDYYVQNEKGWIYALESGDKYFKNMYYEVITFGVITSIIMVIVSAVISIYYTRKVYKPVEKTMQNINRITENNRIHYNNEFKTINDMMMKMNKEKTLSDLLIDSFYDSNQIHTKMTYFRSLFKNENFALAIVKKSTQPGNNIENIEMNKEIVKYLTDEKGENFTHVSLPSNKDIILLLNYSNYENLSKSINDLVVLIRKRFETTVTVMLGEAFNDLYQTYSKYIELRLFSQNRVLREKELIVNYDALTLDKEYSVTYPHKIEYEIIKAIKANDQKLIADSMKDFFEYLFEHHRNAKGKLDNYCVQLLLNLSAKFGISSDYTDLIKSYTYIEQVIKWVMDKIEQYNLQEETINVKYKNYAELIDQYLEENYHEDISLNDIAEHLGVSYSYLRQIFSKIFSCTFKEKINSYRLEKAGQLLLTTKLTISSISEKVGYNNEQTFYRNFKKKYNNTPVEYRQKYS